MSKTPIQEGQRWADVFMQDGDMTREQIIIFFKEQAKAGRRNADRTNSLETSYKNTHKAETYEYATQLVEISSYGL